jgi:hypothetical protein
MLRNKEGHGGPRCQWKRVETTGPTFMGVSEMGTKSNSRWLKSAIHHVKKGSVFALSPHDEPRIKEITTALDSHAMMRQACQFAIDWLESYNVPRQATGDERDEVITILQSALSESQ